MQHFISDSPWYAQAVFDKIACSISNQLAQRDKPVCLNIDESGFIKKGKHSVGVGKQYCGRLGKTENCQVAVFGQLVQGSQGTLIDARLYLPDSWTSDPERLSKAKVPAHHQVFKTKSELGLEIIDHQLTLKNHFDWIGMDAFYGRDFELTKQIEERGLKFIGDVKGNQKVYLEKPVITDPAEISFKKRGRKREKPYSLQKPVSIQAIKDKIYRKSFKTISFRDGTKGKIKAKFYFRKVWAWGQSEDNARERLLIIRKDKNKVKYSLTNYTAGELSHKELAFRQGQRYFIEQSFRELKSCLGMADYQVRKWRAWHHQVAMSMLAGFIVMKLKLKYIVDVICLSFRDVVDWLKVISLPYNPKELETVTQKMKRRHRWRLKDIGNVYVRANLSK